VKKISSSELFELRNTIPVEILLQNILRVPSKISEGVFRFLCPVCNEFQTGINPNVNLVRCFRCGKNFNAIDLVMAIQGCGFKESVLFLKRLLGEEAAHSNDQSLVI
jgi:DNA primase